jgi:hypothetical protein
MLKHIALALLLAGQYAQYYTLEDYEFHEGFKVKCQEPLPEKFACAIIFSLDPSVPDGVASVVGGENDVIRGIGLVLNGTLYTAVCAPPLKRGDQFSDDIKRNKTIPARVEGNDLIIRWPDGKNVKAKIIRREVADPTRPRPA